MRTDLFSAFISGFVSGVVFNSLIQFGWSFAIFLGTVAMILVFLRPRGEQARKIFIVSLFLFASSLGFLRAETERYRYQNVMSFAEDSKVVLRGIISEYPDVRTANTHLNLRAGEVRFLGATTTASEDVLLITDNFTQSRYGDEVLVSGELRGIKNFRTEDNSFFDYREYLAKRGIFHEMIYPKITLISPGEGNKVMQFLFSMRAKFSEKLRFLVSEPDASLALGMLIGEKHGLPEKILDDFKHAGVIHIIVLSGYNIALVSQFFFWVLSFLPLLARTFAGASGIILFILMTGGGASAIRAGVMALIALFGTATGRTYDAGRALFVAGFLMLLENPNLLLYDASFELSFLATFGLIYFSPYISFRLIRIKIVFVRELLAQTIATQFAVLPLLIYLMGQISLTALPANILIVPAVPVAMGLSFIAGAGGFVMGALALPFAFLAILTLSYVIKVANLFASLPFSSIQAGNSALFVVLVFYLVIFVFIFAKKKAPSGTARVQGEG